MISFQQLRSFFLSMSLVAMLTTAMAFGFGSADGWAATSLTQLISQPQIQIATMNQAEAITKNIEGKAQEVIGKITGDPKVEALGKAKQAESQARNEAEDIKENANAVTQSFEDKVKEARGE